MNTELLQQVTAFIWTEADMLDQLEYNAWLELWEEDGLYVVPIDRSPNTEYSNVLNYAYDDKNMRTLRVERLTGGESISTSPVPRTVRQVSRIRIISDANGIITVRAAQLMTEYRKSNIRYNTADVEFQLARTLDSFKIKRKKVLLINSDDALVTVGYIF
ncbi:aromatic-ring-hydroxylating dioxygenase subunit beta [Pseudomonas sp. Z1-14]|uniref:aromatic-ring-hydroxylating dioxygenase subunit beta n=1 Tax=Pseudomonas sp. Z1-14 TaxID=2817409 RepID=UPI003DA7FB80